MGDDKTLSDVLILLTKVSGKLGDRVEKLEKLIGNTAKQSKADKKQATTNRDNKKEDKEDKKDDKVSSLTKMLKLKMDNEQKKPEQVVEQKQEVIISGFGRDASKTLVEAMKGRVAPTKEKIAKPQEEEGFLSKLMKMLPLLGVIVGGLGGLVTALMKGGFGEIWEKIKEGKYKEAWEKAKKKLYEIVSPALKSLPIIGPILSIRDGMEDFDKGNIIGGIKNVVQGIVGLLPIPISAKMGIIGAVDALGAILEKKYGTEQIPQGSGRDVMAGMIKSVGLLAKTGSKFFKRIWLVGSLFSFYEAITDFQTGTPEGISKGVFNLVSGIANLFPGYGTAISIGLDVLSAFIFEEKEVMENGKVVRKISVRDLATKVGTFLSELPILSTFYNIGEAIGNWINGDTEEGFISLAKAVPGGQFLIDLYNYQKEGVDKAPELNVSSFVNIVAESLLKAVISILPKTFGIRYAAAKMFGIKDLPGMPTPEEEAKRLGLTQKQYEVQLEAEKREDKEDKEKQAQTTAGTNAMLGMGFKANDFIKTSDGKLIIPNKDDTLIGLKTDGPLDKFFKSTIKNSEEGNVILKKYAEVSSDILTKQLKLLNDNNKLLNELAGKINTPATVVSRPTTINNYSQGVTLRGMQGAAAY